MEIKNLKILVTGGAGFIGSNLVDELAKENHVIILDDFSSGERENIAHHECKNNVDIVTGDVRDQSVLVGITKGIDIVYHLAVRCLRESIKNPEITHEVNATGTLKVLKVSLENAVKRFIYVFASAAEHQHLFMTGSTKQFLQHHQRFKSSKIFCFHVDGKTVVWFE